MFCVHVLSECSDVLWSTNPQIKGSHNMQDTTTLLLLLLRKLNTQQHRHNLELNHTTGHHIQASNPGSRDSNPRPTGCDVTMLITNNANSGILIRPVKYQRGLLMINRSSRGATMRQAPKQFYRWTLLMFFPPRLFSLVLRLAWSVSLLVA